MQLFQSLYEAIPFIEHFNYFYEHQQGGQEIKNKNLESRFSKNVIKFRDRTSKSINEDTNNDGGETHSEFNFEITSGSVNCLEHKLLTILPQLEI